MHKNAQVQQAYFGPTHLHHNIFKVQNQLLIFPKNYKNHLQENDKENTFYFSTLFFFPFFIHFIVMEENISHDSFKLNNTN